jgi:UDP-glucose 4-epimerase
MIVVFGAGGFIGNYLVDFLVQNNIPVFATDIDDTAREYYKSRDISFESVDITDTKTFLKLPTYDIDAVVNLACLQPVNVSAKAYKETDYIKVNVVGLLNILEYCKKIKANKLIHTISHRGVQGLWSRGEIITEESTKALKYTGEYAMFSISECAAVDCIEYYVQRDNLNGIVFRLPPVYGYGPHLEGYTNGAPLKSGFMTFIESAMLGKYIEVWGDCNKARDIIYVKDVVNAIICSLTQVVPSGLYNISSGEATSLKQEVEEIVNVFSTNKKSSLIYRPEKENSVEEFHYDISKAKKVLNWSPTFSLKKMLEDVKQEMTSGVFNHLITKRELIFKRNNDNV